MPFDCIKFISDLVRFESVSAESARAPAVRACAGFLSGKLSGLGFESEIVSTALHPIVFAKRAAKCAAGERKTRILCYGHYDVQPVDPVEKWGTPPFEPVVKDGRLWGRGSADNKGPFACLLAGLVNFLENNPDAPLDVALMIEGEEEISSPSMEKFIGDRKAELSTYDFIILSDTSSASPSQIVITTGLRGVLSFDVLFKGPNADLHSGVYGGAVYNPIQAMAEICASMHGADGRVNVPGFYDGVEEISAFEKGQIAKHPFNAERMREFLDVDALYEQAGCTPEEATRVMPTLEFTGIGGGYQGEGNKSVIPSECFCKVSCRMVPGQDYIKIYRAVTEAFAARAPKGVKVSFTQPSGSNAYAVCPPYMEDTSAFPSKPALALAFDAMEKSVVDNFGAHPLYLREGGSIPLVESLKVMTGLDCVMLGLFTYEDNLHSPNESMPLEMIEKASRCYEEFFSEIVK